MTGISYTQRYLSHDLNTKFYLDEDLKIKMNAYLKNQIIFQGKT